MIHLYCNFLTLKAWRSDMYKILHYNRWRYLSGTTHSHHVKRIKYKIKYYIVHQFCSMAPVCLFSISSMLKSFQKSQLTIPTGNTKTEKSKSLLRQRNDILEPFPTDWRSFTDAIPKNTICKTWEINVNKIYKQPPVM